MKTIIQDLIWSSNIKEKTYNSLVFQHLSITGISIKNTTFNDCDFKNSVLGQKVNYNYCHFNRSTFSGKYCLLGPSATYVNNHFLKCTFSGNNILNGAVFQDCILTGAFTSLVLQGEGVAEKHFRTKFINCHLGGVEFRNVIINGSNVFINSILPYNGIRKFNNPYDSLIRKVYNENTGIEKDILQEIRFLFKKESRSNQNPIVFDNILLKKQMDTEEKRAAFEEMIKGFEIF
jgi:hypothetical protein